jgi:curli production assembly/transport component CsgG
MIVAGLIIEGGIIGFDANTKSGGHGARILGIGASKQYRVDEIVVALRVISVNTGEILISNSVSKTVYSTAFNTGVMRFIADGTRSVELEAGVAVNEPTTYAIRLAVEQSVYEMIQEGERKGLWSFKQGGSK